MRIFDRDIDPAPRPKGWRDEGALKLAHDVKVDLVDYAERAEPGNINSAKGPRSLDSISFDYPEGCHQNTYTNLITGFCNQIGGAERFTARNQFNGTVRVWRLAEPLDQKKFARALAAWK